MKKIKKFFGIEKSYEFELMDLFAFITILNVVLILVGIWWAPIFGVINCVLNIGFSIRNKTHINFYLMQIALLVLNIYFLTL